MKIAHVALLIALVIATGVRSANAQDTVQIFSIQKDGTGLKELTTGSMIVKPAFSPDGSKIVFDALFGDAPRPNCWATTGPSTFNGKLFLMNSDGTDLHEIHGYSSARAPIFTPDGKKILFTQYDISAGTCSDKLLGIYSINLDGTGTTLIMPDAISGNISPDGSKFVFCMESSFGVVYMSNADGSDAKQLARDQSGTCSRGWGPDIGLGFNPKDSSEIMFYTPSSISKLNIGTLNWSIVLKRSPYMVVAGASYCPDGMTVVYAAKVPGPLLYGIDVSHFDVYEVTTDGTAVRQITSALTKIPYNGILNPGTYSQAYYPACSPDGKTVVFVGRTGR